MFHKGEHAVLLMVKHGTEGFPRPPVVCYSLFWGAAKGIGFQNVPHTLEEYARGLWIAVRVASQKQWRVRVYHDGSVEAVLQRFRAQFTPSELEIVHVKLPHDLRHKKYLCCLLRLFAADDPSVREFVCRDLDDGLRPDGLDMLTHKWLNNVHSGVHVQREAYSTDHVSPAVNMGWYGQRNGFGSWQQRPKVIPMALQFFRMANTDYYTADETFLTKVWIPKLQHSGHAGTIMKLPSHPFRSGHKSTVAFHKFWNAPIGAPQIVDMVLDIEDQ